MGCFMLPIPDDMYNVQYIGGNAQIIGTLVPYENGKAWLENIQYLGEGGIICGNLDQSCRDEWPLVPGQLE